MLGWFLLHQTVTCSAARGMEPLTLSFINVNEEHGMVGICLVEQTLDVFV